MLYIFCLISSVFLQAKWLNVSSKGGVPVTKVNVAILLVHIQCIQVNNKFEHFNWTRVKDDGIRVQYPTFYSSTNVRSYIKVQY